MTNLLQRSRDERFVADRGIAHAKGSEGDQLINKAPPPGEAPREQSSEHELLWMRQLLRDQAPHVDLPPQPPTCAATRLKLAQRTPRKASPSKVIVPFIGTLVALCVSIALYSFIGLPSGVVAVAAIAVGVGAGYLAQLYYAIADRRNDTSSS